MNMAGVELARAQGAGAPKVAYKCKVLARHWYMVSKIPLADSTHKVG